MANRECRVCGNAATCYGRYEGHGDIGFHCDEHCGHGNEDGWCEPLKDYSPRDVLRLVPAANEPPSDDDVPKDQDVDVGW